MSALDHATLLTKLIIACEAALQLRQGLNREALFGVVSDVRTARVAPSDVERVITDEVLMCAEAVLLADAQLRSYSREKARPFLQVVGVLLPELRGALALAIEQRKRPTP